MNDDVYDTFNKKYDRYDFNNIDFYHLHIAKTGGSHLRLFLEENVVKILKNNNIKIAHFDHFGWRPVNDKTYIVSSFRDPVKRAVSHFAYMVYSLFISTNNKNSIYTRHITGFDSRIKKDEDLSPDDLIMWLTTNKDVLSNYQLKNMFYDKEDLYVPKFLIGTTAQLSLSKFNFNDAINNLSRINILLKTEDLTNENMIKMSKLIFNHFNIKDEKTRYFNIRQKINTYAVSQELFNKLSKEYIEEIEKLNKEELEIYNTDSYFTKFDNTPQ